MDRRKASGKRSTERRRHKRYPVRFSVTVKPEGSRQSLDGVLLDVSGRGLLLFLHQTLPVGERVDVELGSPDDPFSLPGRIVWAATRQGLSHVHGVELEREQDLRFAERLSFGEKKQLETVEQLLAGEISRPVRNALKDAGAMVQRTREKSEAKMENPQLPKAQMTEAAPEPQERWTILAAASKEMQRGIGEALTRQEVALATIEEVLSSWITSRNS